MSLTFSDTQKRQRLLKAGAAMAVTAVATGAMIIAVSGRAPLERSRAERAEQTARVAAEQEAAKARSAAEGGNGLNTLVAAFKGSQLLESRKRIAELKAEVAQMAATDPAREQKIKEIEAEEKAVSELEAWGKQGR